MESYLLIPLLGIAVASAALWIVLLRREVRRQSVILHNQVHLETNIAERFRDLVENATDLVFTLDIQGRLNAANHAAQATFGVFGEDLKAMDVRQFIVPEDRQAFEDIMALLMGGERNILKQLSIIAPEDRRCVVEMNCRIRHTDGKPAFFEVIARDVTQQKLEQEALERARAAAEAASRAKSQFLANMSHELRTPLNGILGMTELTLQTSLQPDQRNNLEVVRRSTEALITVLNDILDYSAIETGRLELQPKTFDFAPLVQDCLDLIALPVAQRGVELKCDIDPSLPKEWTSDAGRLRQILVNLLGNAAKFTHVGQIGLKVDRIDNADNSISARFMVHDTGIGITREYQKQIFEMFSQADGSFSRKYDGIGLGLAIASRLVTLLGGRLNVSSAVGQGSTFHFTIPVASSNTAKRLHKTPTARKPDDLWITGVEDSDLPKAAPEPPAAPSTTRILLAEDNRVNQMLAVRILEKAGYGVSVANNGREAVDLLAGVNPDLVLMDIQMPEMDGIEATIRIRQQSAVPIIALTAHALKGDRERCLSAGMTDYISKPVRPAELVAMVGRYAPVSITPA